MSVHIECPIQVELDVMHLPGVDSTCQTEGGMQLAPMANRARVCRRARKQQISSAASVLQRVVAGRQPRALKVPAPIGPIPRMLDQLKRRASRLLLKSPDGPVRRAPVYVTFNSADVRSILANWHGRSAFAEPVPNDSPEAAGSASIFNSNTGRCDDAKLSLLVWRPPEMAEITQCGEAPHTQLALAMWHVIPVTQQEAMQFQHIPVEMRESMVGGELRCRIAAGLAAMSPNPARMLH